MDAPVELAFGTGDLPHSGQVETDSFYKITGLSSGSDYQITLTGLFGDLDLYVYDTSNHSSVAGTSTSGGTADEAVNVTATSDTLFVKVNNYDGGQQTFTLGASAPENTAPAPGNSGTITASGIEETSLTLNWTAASDDTSAAADLQYLAYFSTSDDIDTVANAEAYGTAVGSYEANISTKTIIGLTAGTTYYFTVIVKDEAGNKAAYGSIYETPELAGELTAGTPYVLTVTVSGFGSYWSLPNSTPVRAHIEAYDYTILVESDQGTLNGDGDLVVTLPVNSYTPETLLDWVVIFVDTGDNGSFEDDSDLVTTDSLYLITTDIDESGNVNLQAASEDFFEYLHY